MVEVLDLLEVPDLPDVFFEGAAFFCALPALPPRFPENAASQPSAYF